MFDIHSVKSAIGVYTPPFKWLKEHIRLRLPCRRSARNAAKAPIAAARFLILRTRRRQWNPPPGQWVAAKGLHRSMGYVCKDPLTGGPCPRRARRC